MGMERTTIFAPSILMKRVNEHVTEKGDKLTSFFTRAIMNQLEREGNFTVRDEVEDEVNVSREESN